VLHWLYSKRIICLLIRISNMLRILWVGYIG
jgi:hypothetical protein